MSKKLVALILCFVGPLQGCSSLTVVNSDQQKQKGTLAYDYKTGKLVATYSCTMVGANGKRVYATAKSEEDARKEVISKCQEQTLISFCNDSKINCQKN